jgi:hypothetical protein
LRARWGCADRAATGSGCTIRRTKPNPACSAAIAQLSVDHFAQALCQLLYGEGFKIECPTGSGISLSIDEAADELSGRLTRIFRKNANGHSPVHGRDERLQNDARFKD